MFLRKWTLVIAAAAVTITASTASAQVTCSSLTGPIYVAGSTAIQPLVAAMAQSLASSNSPANTIIYDGQGSCVGADDVLNDNAAIACAVGGSCITGTALYWDATTTTTTPKSCNLDALGNHVDVGVSDVFAKTCTATATTPAGFIDVNGPVQSFGYVVPTANDQTTFTAAEGYFVFGFGAAGMVTPFTTDANVFVRSATSGTQIVTAETVGLPSGKFGTKGTSESSNGTLAPALIAAMPAESAIGILGTATYDTKRAMLKLLAFKAFNQWTAWYPDSSATTFDKRNVRDGHYVAWGYEHLIVAGTNNTPTSASAKTFVNWINGTLTGPWGTNVNALASAAGFVPNCAMHVQRSGEGTGTDSGALSYYHDAATCDCSYEFAATKSVPASCVACTMNSPCTAAGTTCRNGYCEIQ